MHLGIKIDISENVQSQALREEQVKNICLEVLDDALSKPRSDTDLYSALVRSQLNEHASF